ncbi:NADH-quinone oxidoreductase subunit J family protein [Flectobacillus major]|uniref:NADH-quinone oxidoreductase subunit J family protein n=1 Tax=Flectobacillus major TaxID=103 RepID=UPI00040D3052|nr:NADH-quinone oxidoreductase subunit J [Flectobacillus major]
MIQVLFIFFVVLTLASASVVLATKNVLYAAFSLLGTFLGIAALYVLSGADFLAVTQILVYVGGVLVLLIFGVMLTNQRGNKGTGKNDIVTESSNRILGVIVAIGIFITLFYTIGRSNFVEAQSNLFDPIELGATTQTIGVSLMTSFVLPFEVTGILLMAVLIGAAYLSTKTKP